MKTYTEVLDELNQVFRQVFNNPSLVVSPQTTAADIRNWDSLNHMHLIAEVEEHFNCEFSFDEVVNFKNVGDMIQALLKKF
jgi:acyl carrier protein